MTSEAFEHAAAVTFRLALTAREPGFALEILDRILSAEEQDYINKNADVADAVARGTFSSGLDHYQRAGAKEGRRGFPALQEAQAAVGVLLDTAPPLSAIRHLIARLNEAETALSARQDGTPRTGAVKTGGTRSDGLHRPEIALGVAP
jgi:hypothetical protein